ncbi:hypothetical protein P7K49_029566 [Saguinus oedipus]|uniref:Uncharacterized protein n=1 Tax=Saguinus oedipus TaxID=9490 RepID=A0ABQ9U9K5_SAGOE|nr:hypothetical protein P7K49_029566 [Saguinus oedipus]
MGHQALLLLLVAFLVSRTTTALQLALRALGSLHLPANPTSHLAVAKNYSQYLIADKCWKKEDRDIIWFCSNTWFIWYTAEELKAMLVYAEQRYCGDSLPCDDPFKDSGHLYLLTSEQALADSAELIKHLNRTILGAENHPVVALQGPYGGMFAA